MIFSSSLSGCLLYERSRVRVPLAVDSSHLKRGSIAHSLSFSSFHRLDMTKILVKDVKLDTSYFRAKKGNSKYVLGDTKYTSKS